MITSILLGCIFIFLVVISFASWPLSVLEEFGRKTTFLVLLIIAWSCYLSVIATRAFLQSSWSITIFLVVLLGLACLVYQSWFLVNGVIRSEESGGVVYRRNRPA